MEILEVVQRFEQRFARPVCDGCPDPKKFDEQVAKWSTALAEQLAHETGERWGVLQNSVTGAGLVELLPDAGPGGGVRIHPWFVVDHPAGGKTIEYTPTLSSERRSAADTMPGVSWVIPTNHLREGDRDRVGEALERLARIEQQLEHLANREHQRSLASIGFLQRLLILTNHYGTAPAILEWRILGRVVRLEFRHPQVDQPAIREPK